MRIAFLLASALLAPLAAPLSAPVLAQPAGSILCADGLCRPAIEQTTFFDRPAYRLTNGKEEVVVVPSIGRIMSYGKVGGPNLFWNAASTKAPSEGWANFGGDKNWLAPQSYWGIFHGKAVWPPDPALDGQPHDAEVLSGGKLRMTSPLSPGTGIRIERVIYFDDKTGELVVEQSAIKEKGAPIRASIWNIAQTVPGEAVYLPTNPNSPYKNNFYWFDGKPKPAQKTELIGDNVLKVVPAPAGGGAKIGADSDVSSIASVNGDTALLLKSARPSGDYPDGNVPVELYINGNPDTFYIELELLSPLRDFRVGSKWTHTIRYSLHDLPAENRDEAVAALLRASDES